MKGAIATDTMFNIVLGIIVLIGIILIASQGLGMGGDIRKWFGDMLSRIFELFPKENALKSAIECSYYRCVKGCDSIEVKNIKWKLSDNEIKCVDFCDEHWQDFEGKICGDDAAQYPVEIRLDSKEEMTISKDKLKIFHCIFSDDPKKVGITRGWTIYEWIRGWVIPFPPDHSILFIENKLVYDKELINCRIPGYKGSGDIFLPEYESIKECKTNSKQFYIFSEVAPKGIVLEGEARGTYIMSEPGYIELEPDTLKFEELPDRKKFRLVVKDKSKIVEDAIIELPYTGKYGGKGYAGVKFICDYGKEELESVYAGDSHTFCDGRYFVKINIIEHDFSFVPPSITNLPSIQIDTVVAFQIKYIDPKCHTKSESDCGPGCQRWWYRDPNTGRDEWGMCCYHGEDFDEETKTCEGFTPLDCHGITGESECTGTVSCEWCREKATPFGSCCYSYESCNRVWGRCE